MEGVNKRLNGGGRILLGVRNYLTMSVIVSLIQNYKQNRHPEQRETEYSRLYEVGKFYGPGVCIHVNVFQE